MRETGREGPQEETGGCRKKRAMAEVTDRLGERNGGGEKARGEDTRERQGSCERDKERRKTDTRKRQRWERDGGSLEVQGAQTPQPF